MDVYTLLYLKQITNKDVCIVHGALLNVMRQPGWKESLGENVKSLSHVQLFATLWTVAYQAPLSIGFSRQEDCRGLPLPSPWDFSDPGIEPRLPTLQAGALASEPLGENGCVCVPESLAVHLRSSQLCLFTGCISIQNKKLKIIYISTSLFSFNKIDTGKKKKKLEYLPFI